MKKPSVTKLLDLLAKPALIEWANRKGLAGIDIGKLRKQRKADGTSLHIQAANASVGKVDAFIDPLHRRSFDRFFATKQIASVECDIETDWFVGRYDVEYFDEDGVRVMADYKSRFKRLYLEHKLQLVAYTMAKPGDMAVIAIPQFVAVPVVIENREPYESILKSLSSIYQAMKVIEA